MLCVFLLVLAKQQSYIERQPTCGHNSILFCVFFYIVLIPPPLSLLSLTIIHPPSSHHTILHHITHTQTFFFPFPCLLRGLLGHPSDTHRDTHTQTRHVCRRCPYCCSVLRAFQPSVDRGPHSLRSPHQIHCRRPP